MNTGNTNGSRHIHATYDDRTKTLTVTGEGWALIVSVPTRQHLGGTLRRHGLKVKDGTKWQDNGKQIVGLLKRARTDECIHCSA